MFNTVLSVDIIVYLLLRELRLNSGFEEVEEQYACSPQLGIKPRLLPWSANKWPTMKEGDH